MTEGSIWELHAVSAPYFQCPTGSTKLISFKKKCDRRHPPGRKVYQRGAHTIWEVDGAKEKVSRLNVQCPLMSPLCLSYSSIVKICRFSGSSSSMSRHYSLTATTVRMVLFPALQTLKLCSFLLHTDGCGFATRPCVRIFLQGCFPPNNLRSSLLTRDCRKNFLTMTTISLA